MPFDFTVLKSAVRSPLNDSYPLLAQNPGGLSGTDALNENSRKLVKKKNPTQANSLCSAWHTTHFHNEYKDSSKGCHISCILYSPVWVTEKRSESLQTTWYQNLFNYIQLFVQAFLFLCITKQQLNLIVIHQLSTKTTIQYPWTYPSAENKSLTS